MIDGFAKESARGSGELADGPDARSAEVALLPVHLEPRCRVCRSDEVRRAVNRMLAAGCSYAGIVRSLAIKNAELADDGRVSVDSVRNHALRHFRLQNLAQATYREALQRRAQESQVGTAGGLATALTPMAFMEAVMAKSFIMLAQGDTEVPVETGLLAAHQLQAMLAAHAPVVDGQEF